MLRSDYPTPGHLLDDLIEKRGWNQKLVAAMIGVSESIISKVLSGVRPIDAELAIKLGELFSVDPLELLILQQKFDLNRAKITVRADPTRSVRAEVFAELPLKDMLKRGWIDAPSIQDVKAVEESLLKFFGRTALEDVPLLTHAARKTESKQSVAHQEAWLYRVKKIAEDQMVGEYSEFALRRAIKELEGLLNSVDALKRIPRILAEAGIRFVVVETIAGAKIDGACFWLNESSPVIGMTLRYDRIDNFWFVLRHELEHVLRRHGMDVEIIDSEVAETSNDDLVSHQEAEANEAAKNFGIKDAHIQHFVRVKAPYFKESDLLGFANTVKVHPGIVAGRLQYVTKRYDLFRHHLVKVRAKIVSTAIVDGWGEVYPIM